jgi:hypothetical protein
MNESGCSTAPKRPDPHIRDCPERYMPGRATFMSEKPRHYVEDLDDDVNETNDLLDNRSTLVRIRRGPDTAIFGGWGPKI